MKSRQRKPAKAANALAASLDRLVDAAKEVVKADAILQRLAQRKEQTNAPASIEPTRTPESAEARPT